MHGLLFMGVCNKVLCNPFFLQVTLVLWPEGDLPLVPSCPRPLKRTLVSSFGINSLPVLCFTDWKPALHVRAKDNLVGFLLPVWTINQSHDVHSLKSVNIFRELCLLKRKTQNVLNEQGTERDGIDNKRHLGNKHHT